MRSARRVGKENIFIFGMETPEAEALAASGSYEPMVIYQNDPVIRRVRSDQMIHGFGDGVDYTDIANLLLHGGNGGPADRYMSLKDFASYAAAQERVSEVYRDQDKWNRMALISIANSQAASQPTAPSLSTHRISGELRPTSPSKCFAFDRKGRNRPFYRETPLPGKPVRAIGEKSPENFPVFGGFLCLLKKSGTCLLTLRQRYALHFICEHSSQSSHFPILFTLHSLDRSLCSRIIVSKYLCIVASPAPPYISHRTATDQHRVRIRWCET